MNRRRKTRRNPQNWICSILLAVANVIVCLGKQIRGFYRVQALTFLVNFRSLRNSKDQRIDTDTNAEKKNVATQTETNNEEKKKKKFSLVCILLFCAVSFVGIMWIFYPRLTQYPSISPPSDLEYFLPIQDSLHSAEVFHSPEVFKKDYMDMERNFKIFVYPYTDKDVVDDKQRRLSGKYGSEEYFFENLLQSHFLTKYPDNAHLFFIPISCRKLRREGRSHKDMAIAFQDYVKSLITKYPYWNRTLGADHFFVTCHDIGGNVTELLPHLMKNLIRVVCSPSYNVEYVPRKDVTLPQIIQPFALPSGGNNLKNRTVLAFWAGRRSSNIRDKLIQAWQNDTELDIQNERIDFRNIKGRIVYQEKFYRSKFCICPGALHVHGARIAEAIHYGCVPVILSDYSVLPFNGILDWKKFSVILKEKDVHRLKKILKRIPDEKYRILQDNTVKLQKHFQWNSPSVQLDAFHMVLYELWLRHHVVKYEHVDTETHSTKYQAKK